VAAVREDAAARQQRAFPGLRLALPHHVQTQPLPLKTTASVVCAALSFAVLAGCAAAPLDKPLKTSKVETGMGTLTDARSRLTGTWTLVSFDLFPPGEPPIHAAGTGIMTYDEFSNLKVDLRLTPASVKLAEKIGIPVTPEGSITTVGHAVIDLERRALSYVLEGQSPMRQAKHPLDTNLPRYWELKGDELTLRTKDEKGTVLSVSVWRKN
jgi:hypothetical protein